MHRSPDFASPRAEEDEIERATVRICRELETHHLATAAPSSLVRGDERPFRSGSKPLLTLTDASGHYYVFKIATPDLMAAEQAAYELRRLGRRPCIPARVVRVELPELGLIEGLLKPFIEFDREAELETDTRSWSELQRLVILREHAWEWFLDNLDTNTSQYALLGPNGYPLNVDWDRAFSSNARSEFSRFAKYRRALPNARTFLYADYVEGRVDLDFSLLRREALRIRQLPVKEVRRIVADYANVRFQDAAAARELTERVLRRQRHIDEEVARSIKRIKAERRRLLNTGRSGFRERSRLLSIVFWNHSQVALNKILRGPLGTLGRRMLKRARSFTLGLSRVPPGPPPAGSATVGCSENAVHGA